MRVLLLSLLIAFVSSPLGATAFRYKNDFQYGTLEDCRSISGFPRCNPVTARGYRNQPCVQYGCNVRPTQEPFLPAPPGHAPRCARPGQTFCESPDRYPQQLIRFLVDKCTVDPRAVFRDESRYEYFSYRQRPTYNRGYDYPRSAVPTGLYSREIYGSSHQTFAYNPSLNITSQQSYDSEYSPEQNSFLPHNLQIKPGEDYQVQPNVQTFADAENSYSKRNSHGVRTRRQNPILEFKDRVKRQTDANTVSICPTRKMFISPRAALNSQGNWMYIVNLGEQSKSQLVRSEICMRDTCDGICSLPSGYTSRCQQQYVQKRLVALEGSGNRLYTDIFWLPHGCMCQVTLDY